MSNRNRDDRDYDENRQTQGTRYQGSGYGQHESRERGNFGRDRDIQSGFSGGNRLDQGYYASSQERAWRESPASGGSYVSPGMQGYGPSTGAGSQGFGPEGYGTQRYEGQRYEGAEYEGIGYGASQGDRFHPERYGSPYGRELGSQAYGEPRGYGMGERAQESYGQWDRPRMGNMQGRGFQPSSSYPGQRYGGSDRDMPQRYGQGSHEQSLYGERGSNPSLYGQQGYGQPGYGSSGLSTQQYGQQGLYGQAGYRGLGPKNFTRSDERIREDINERLTDADEIDASGITVEVSQGVVTLSGTVDQRWAKHRAEDLAESCGGVRDVHNQIRVQSKSETTSASRSSSVLGAGSAGASSSSATTGSGSGSAGTSPASGSSTSRTGGHS